MEPTFIKPSIDRDKSDRSGVNVYNSRYKHLPLARQRELLPIFKHKREILYCIEKYRTLILVGETGCGKSTQLPLYLHEANWTDCNYSIVCTQPRRIAAINVATRVAEEFGCKVGEEVGYGIRFDFQCRPNTKIRYYTDGILLRETMNDPLLSKYSVIIVDEAHQRSLHSDILIGLLKKIQKRRPELRIIITSATMNAEYMKSFFETNLNSSSDPSNDTAYILSIQGRQYPVDVFYLQSPCRNYLSTAVQTILQIHEKEELNNGDILVFLPGSEEIDTLIRMLEENYQGNELYFLPLHSTLPHHLQVQVFYPTPANRRKVVIATNIAEASITIENIRYVIDSGLVKLNYFNVENGLDMLVTTAISKAEARQRSGRAGRTQPGKSYRLMTEEYFDQQLLPFTPPEMQRVDITWAVLQLQAIGIKDILHFDFLSPPTTNQMIFALELLYSLDAIDDHCQITKVGIYLAEMPIEPRLGKCLLSSVEMGCSEEMLIIASMTSVEYPFITIRSNSKNAQTMEAKVKLEKDIKYFTNEISDHLTLLNIYREFELANYSQSWCDSNSLLYRVLYRAKEIRQNLFGILRNYSLSNDRDQLTSNRFKLTSCNNDDRTLRRCLVTGFFSHVAKLDHDGIYKTIRGNVSVLPYQSSVLERSNQALPEYVLFHEIIHTKQAYIRELTKIEPMWLYELAKHYYDLKM